MKLGVNIDHVATLRQVRLAKFPDPVHAAVMAEQAGCHSIVAHLREDRRHINERDIKLIREVIGVKFNLEISIAQEIIKIALKIKPDEVTIVPERRQEVTTEGGLDVLKNKNKLKEIIQEFKREKIDVSLFLDPEVKQIKAAKEISANYVEIHTGRYAEAYERGNCKKELESIINCVKFAKEIGLNVNAGHGLNYKNVREIAKISEIETLNIGHAIISKAIFVGIKQAVNEMLELIT